MVTITTRPQTAQIIPFWEHDNPTNECAMEVQTLMCATEALCRRFLEQPDVVREEAADIGKAHGRLGLLLSAMMGRTLVAAE